MNYRKHYDLLIERAKTRTLDCYFERHHVVPRCIGGTDDKENLVELTPEEHFVAHQLLIKMYPDVDALVYAANKMTVASTTLKRNNKRYGWLKRRYQSVCKKRIGDKNPSYGKYWYYNPKTGTNGKFTEKEVPTGWIKGRQEKKKHVKKCEKCNFEFEGNKRNRFCKKCVVEAKIHNGKAASTKNQARSKYQEYEVIQALRDSNSISECCKKLGLSGRGNSYYRIKRIAAENNILFGTLV
jgi:hypothetical protein